MIECLRIRVHEFSPISMKCGSRSHIHRSPLIENGNIVRNLDGKVNVVRDEQNTLARIRKLAQDNDIELA